MAGLPRNQIVFRPVAAGTMLLRCIMTERCCNPVTAFARFLPARILSASLLAEIHQRHDAVMIDEIDMMTPFRLQ
jgi:hypothetical protein